MSYQEAERPCAVDAPAAPGQRTPQLHLPPARPPLPPRRAEPAPTRPGPETPGAAHEPRHSSVTLLAQRETLADVLRRLTGAPVADTAAAAIEVPLWRARAEAVLFHEGGAAHTLYVVRSGSFKCVRTLEDGYEQVVSFVQPGGLLGIDSPAAGVHRVSAVALEDATVYALAARELPVLQQRCPALAQALWRGISRRMGQAAELAEMMAPVASEARLARFLLWLSRRMAEAEQSPRRLHLHMARRDIASLLGVAHETVSRSFTTLAERGCLRVDNREVEIIDFAALHERARCTRGTAAEAGARGDAAARCERTSWWGALAAA